MGALYSTIWTSSTLTTAKTTIPINGHIRTLNLRPSSYNPERQYLKMDKSLADTNVNIDLSTSSTMPEVYDQGHLGSCTAQGLCFAFKFDILNAQNTDDDFDKDFEPSRLYLYFKERESHGSVSTDSGANISDGIDVLKTNGVCSESNWSYIVEKFAEKPPLLCDAQAHNHRSLVDRRVLQNMNDILSCLTSKLPVVFGFAVYESFQNISSDNAIASLPKQNEALLGAHCCVIIGFCNDTKLFKVRNSWGENFGDKGNFYLPQEYVLNDKLAFDFTVISQIFDENDSLEKRINTSIAIINSRVQTNSNLNTRKTYKQILLSKKHN